MLRYEVTIRSYGALSTTFRRKVGWIQNPPLHKPPPELIPLPAPAAILLPPTEPTPPSQRPQEQEEDSAFLRKRRRNWARLFARMWLSDPNCVPGVENVCASSPPSPAQPRTRSLKRSHQFLIELLIRPRPRRPPGGLLAAFWLLPGSGGKFW